MEPTGRAADLNGTARRFPKNLIIRGRITGGKEIADEEPDGANEGIAEDTDGVDLDPNTGRFSEKKLRRNLEEEFVVPGGVSAVFTVNASSKLGGGIGPSDGVGLHGAKFSECLFQSLGGY